MGTVTNKFQQFLEQRNKEDLLRRLRREDYAGTHARSSRHVEYDGRVFVNFSSNDYLGLSTHPELVKRSCKWAEKYGTGSRASRLVTGNLACLEQTEEKLARLKGTETALVMASGFQANAAVVQALLDRAVHGKAPLVFADKLNHASLHFGCGAAGVRQIRYRHLDMTHLRQLLERHAGEQASRFILTESVFSMDGDCAPLADIQALAHEFDAFLLVDDAHAFGCFGPEGAGLARDEDITIGTFSKAAGGFGAYIACSGLLREYLVNRCGGIIYSTALPPNVLGAIDAALDLIPQMEDARKKLQENARLLREGLARLGLDSGQSQSQIVPVLVGTAHRALRLQEHLARAGFWTTAIRPPTVPHGMARIRLACSTVHKEEDITALLAGIAEQDQWS